MSKYFDQSFPKYQCGFRQGYNTQNCLLVIAEKWEEVLNNGRLGGVLLTDLSSTFDSIKHDLLIAKITTAYGFDSHSLCFYFQLS